MSTPCEEQVVQAVATALGALAGVTFRRNPTEPAVAGTDTVDLHEDGAQPVRDFVGEDGKTLRVTVEMYAFAATDSAADAARSSLRALVEQAMGGLLATSGLPLRDVRPSEEPAPPSMFLDAAGPARACALSWDIEFATAERDPFTFA